MSDFGLTSQSGEVLAFLDSLITIRADRERTGGQLGLSESWAPRGHCSPLHMHSREDEAFFVVDGEMQFWLGDDPFPDDHDAGRFRGRVPHRCARRQPGDSPGRIGGRR